MVNYVYQPKTLGSFLAIYFFPLLEVTHHERQADVIKIYHGSTLIGVNVEQPESKFGSLPIGVIRHFNPKQFEVIQQWLKQPPYHLALPTFHSGFRIGRIVKIETHPDADALYVTQVEFGDQTLQIVTNSSKVKIDAKVVVALPGAMLSDGQVIVEGPMLKVNSQGMLTSQKTLGIYPETQTGVYLLPEEAIIGKDFYDQ